MLRRSTLLIASLVSTAAFAAEPVYPPGSRVGLVPPAGMVAAQGIAGFRNERTGAGIVVIEMPAEAYPSVAAGFGDESLKQQNFTLKRRETPKFGKSDGIMITGEQRAEGQVIPKTIMVGADGATTFLVIGQAPPNAPAAEVEAIEAAVKSVTIRAPLAIEEQVSSLPFRIGDLAGFRAIRAMAGNSLLLTDGPKDVVKEAEQPIVIVAQSYQPAPPPDQREVFARAALTSNTFLNETVFERSQGFRQGGADWHEIVAKAKDGHSGNPVVVMQTIRFAPTGYIRMVGVVRADQRDLALPRFRRVVDSIAER